MKRKISIDLEQEVFEVRKKAKMDNIEIVMNSDVGEINNDVSSGVTRKSKDVAHSRIREMNSSEKPMDRKKEIILR